MTANCVVIADDENLDIARAHRFETLEMNNEYVGSKVNAGFAYAAKQGADYMCFVGSDDWLHVDLFRPLVDSDNRRNVVLSGREITLVDLSRGVMTTMHNESLHGVIPWLFPVSHFPLVPPLWNKGLDWPIYYQLRELDWIFTDPHPHTRVDFKSDTNITPYSVLGRCVGNTPEVSLRELEGWYPSELVDLAEELA